MKLTYEEFKNALHKEKRNLLTEEIFNTIKQIDNDPDFDLRNELLTYTNVLMTGKYKVTDYARACKYVALKNAGFTNKNAYARVFPERVNRWIEEGKDRDFIDKRVNKYNNSKLVVEITKKALIPTKILNQDKVQKALNVLDDLMMNAKSEMVRFKSAEALVRELKIEDDNKLELDITVKKDESLVQLEEKLAEFSAMQLEAIKNKQVNVKQIAEMDIITVETEE